MFLDLLYTQDDRGWLSGAGPIDNSSDEISKAMWSIEYLLCYYKFTGDIDFLKQVYERIRCFMNYLARLENKQILIDGKNEFNNIRGRSVWIDDHTISSRDRVDLDLILFSFNTLYYGTLNCMGIIADAVGKTEDAKLYRSKAAFLKESFNRVFWNTETQMYVDWVKDSEKADEIQDAFLILALYYGICDRDKAQKVLTYLFEPSSGTLRNFEDYRFTFGYYYFIFDVLYKYGMDKAVCELMRTYFGAWLGLGFTAFGEHFFLPEAKGKKTLGREINVHLDSTAAHVFFYSNILGIQPVFPGFRKTVIAPLPGDIRWASGNVYTPVGIVDVSWKVENDRFHIEIVIPENMECNIVIPKHYQPGQIKKTVRMSN